MIESLVKLAQEGDREAFARLYDLFIDPIYRYVYYRVSLVDAEDLVETIFLKMWEHIRQYKRQKKSFSAWAFRIAHNLVVDYYRANKDKMYEELTSNIPDQDRRHNPVKVTEGNLDKEMLKKAILSLRKDYQDIIVHKFVNELSNKEIADILGKSEGSLRILQFRALKALRKELEEFGLDY